MGRLRVRRCSRKRSSLPGGTRDETTSRAGCGARSIVLVHRRLWRYGRLVGRKFAAADGDAEAGHAGEDEGEDEVRENAADARAKGTGRGSEVARLADRSVPTCSARTRAIDLSAGRCRKLPNSGMDRSCQDTDCPIVLHGLAAFFAFTSQNRSTHTYRTLSGFLGGATHRYTSPWSFVLPSL